MNIKLLDSPRYYQSQFIENVKALIKSKPDGWHLFYAPTNTGKSLCELLLLNEYPDFILITPRIEIIAGMLEKMGYYVEDMSTEQIVLEGQKFHIFTPIRLRNILAQGRLPYQVSGVIIDEAHHDLAETYQDITMYLNSPTKIGLTASPYRGTPKQSSEFLKQWGNVVHTIISLTDAVEKGYFSIPCPTIWPLLDDDEIDVSNGEFKVSTVTSKICNRLTYFIDKIKQQRWFNNQFHLYDKPTMIAVNSSDAVQAVVLALNFAGLPAVGVTEATNRRTRAKAFEDVKNCKSILVQINVVSEGVDLPIQRIIDIKPTMSPVRWIQQVGRIRVVLSSDPDTANGESFWDGLFEDSHNVGAEYICCCRNIERHGYLYEGFFPNSIYKESQTLFNKLPSKRSGLRAVGLEGLGKFTVIPLALHDGVTAFMYNLVNVENYKRTEYCIIIHPNWKDILRCKRESTYKLTDDRPKYDWGRWGLIESIPDMRGFSTAKPSPLTDRQRSRWNQDAARYGLNTHVPVDNRNIQVLFVLKDIGARF